MFVRCSGVQNGIESEARMASGVRVSKNDDYTARCNSVPRISPSTPSPVLAVRQKLGWWILHTCSATGTKPL